jgi:hypothetical protein
LLYLKLFTGAALSEWGSALSVITFLFGTLFILLGILGDYVGRILLEARGRPRFLISERVGFEDTRQSGASPPVQFLLNGALIAALQSTNSYRSLTIDGGQNLHPAAEKTQTPSPSTDLGPAIDPQPNQDTAPSPASDEASVLFQAGRQDLEYLYEI